jgi:hypothetical protein
MNKLYDRRFWFGFFLTVGVLVVMNVFSFCKAEVFHDPLNDMPHRANWGFPFYFWGYSNWIFEDGSVGLFLNFVSAVVASSVIGLACKFISRAGLK